MDHIFARIKRLRKNPFFKVVSNHTLYAPIKYNVASGIPYDPNHKLDEDTWFKIEKFSKQSYCLDFLKNQFDSKDYLELPKGKFEAISYIFSTQGQDFYFQKVSPSLFIRRKILAFGEAAEVEEGGSRLLINELPDAVYLAQLDTLVFKNLPAISSIFEGIDTLYKEATTPQVSDFLSQNFIATTPAFTPDMVSKPNRRRIAMTLDTLGNMTPKDCAEMLAYIHSYSNGHLNFDAKSQKFTVSKDEDLRLLLYGVDERFYTTQRGKEKRLANSVQKF